MLAPLGVGGHVDHVLVRIAAERSGARSRLLQRLSATTSGTRPTTRSSGATAWSRRAWPRSEEAKAELVRAYRTQIGALFPGGHIPLVPEVFYFPPETPSGAPELGGASG